MDIRITPLYSNKSGSRFSPAKKNPSVTITNALPEPGSKRTRKSSLLNNTGIRPASKIKHQGNLLLITSANTHRNKTSRFSPDFTTIHQQRGLALYQHIEQNKIFPEGTELVNRVSLRA